MVIDSPLAARLEALALLRDVVSGLVEPKRDLVLLLRRFEHGCRLADLSENVEWAQRELRGYATNDQLPEYRQQVLGVCRWAYVDKRAGASDDPQSEDLPADTSRRGNLSEDVGRLQASTQYGAYVPTGARDYRRPDSVSLEIVEYFWVPPNSLRQVITAIEARLHSQASGLIKALAFGNSLLDLWVSQRAGIESAFVRLDVSFHFESISRNLRSDNPQDWRGVLYSCRDILHDVAERLWQVSRKEYPHLLDRERKPIKVTDNAYINRLKAYLHQKSVSGTHAKYLRAEMDRIAESIHTLNSLASGAHSGAERADAELAAVGTYMILAELARRTDLVPIERFIDELAPSEVQ